MDGLMSNWTVNNCIDVLFSTFKLRQGSHFSILRVSKLTDLKVDDFYETGRSFAA